MNTFPSEATRRQSLDDKIGCRVHRPAVACAADKGGGNFTNEAGDKTQTAVGRSIPEPAISGAVPEGNGKCESVPALCDAATGRESLGRAQPGERVFPRCLLSSCDHSRTALVHPSVWTARLLSLSRPHGRQRTAYLRRSHARFSIFQGCRVMPVCSIE
jgi:hypothetical protein